MDTKMYSMTENETVFRNLCGVLNMDKETEETAWANYVDAARISTLEGDQRHWMCCALFAACTECFRPTVGGSNEMVKNCVNLTKLLRVCEVSLYDFFIKAKDWCEMAKVSKNFLSKVERLQQSCKITLNIKDSYCKIFHKIFIALPHVKKNKKSRPGKCSASKLYDFGWCLFLCAKNQGITCTDDLLSSFHLLLCCINLIYVNALAENRVDLINPNYEGVPDKWNTPEFDRSTIHKHCIIEQLCKTEGGIEKQAKLLKIDAWKKIMNEFLNTKMLYGDRETFMGIISINNFEPNLKSLNSAYDQYVLSVGEFDERILPPSINSQKNNSDPSGVHSFSQNINSSGPDTPLLRRNQLPAKDKVINPPVIEVTQNVQILEGFGADQDHIIEFIKQIGESTLEKLEAKHETMRAMFREKFPNQANADEFYSHIRHLHFYLLDKIVRTEMATKPNLPPKIALEMDAMNTALIACSAEIVIFAHELDLKFPWVLQCFNLKAFDFIKIIEVVVKRQDKLSRGTIKHLNYCEETCLESLIWASDSPFWEIAQKRKAPLPTWAEVDVNNMARNMSQMNVSYDGFNPSSTATTSDSARRDLFNAGKAHESKPNDPTKPSQHLSMDKPLKIALRKVYALAWMRMKELCKELNMAVEEYMNKIWTLFEHSITQRTELMKDRHLDQLLMCAIYIFVKVGELPGKTFTDIMRMYRKQPQSASHIYREILIDPTKRAAERTNDIIYFYNNIYVKKMTPYALSFGDKNKSHVDLLLSPHPTDRVNPPKKISNQIYVHQMDKHQVTYSPNSFIYEINKSPAKELHDMNEIVRRGNCKEQNQSLGKRKAEDSKELIKIIHPGKRILQFNDEDSTALTNPESNRFHCQLLSIKKDRQAGQKD